MPMATPSAQNDRMKIHRRLLRCAPTDAGVALAMLYLESIVTSKHLAPFTILERRDPENYDQPDARSHGRGSD